MYRDASIALFCVAPLSNGNNSLNHKNINRRVSTCKIPLYKTLLLAI